MSELALETRDVSHRIAALPSDQPAPLSRSAPGKVTGRLKVAIDAMVWLGLKRAEAAEHAGLKEHSLYVAFTRPHVKAHYLSLLEVLRTSERARNIHTLAEVRDQKTNQMARVQAVKVLEQISDEQHAHGPVAPFSGVVVNIITAPGDRTVHAQAGNSAQVIDNTEDSQS